MTRTYWSLIDACLSIYSSSSSTWNDSLLWLISGRERRFLSIFVDDNFVSLVDGADAGSSDFFDLKTMRWLRSAGFSVSSVNQKHYRTEFDENLMRIWNFTRNIHKMPYYARQKYLLITRALANTKFAYNLIPL